MLQKKTEYSDIEISLPNVRYEPLKEILWKQVLHSHRRIMLPASDPDSALCRL